MSNKICPISQSPIPRLMFYSFKPKIKPNSCQPSHRAIQTFFQCQYGHGNPLRYHYFNPIATRNPKAFQTNVRYSLKIPRHDRGPQSTEDTQTDFGNLDILGNTPAPSTSIDACIWDGFHLNSGVKITGGKGVLLVGGKAFSWQPWLARKDKKKKLLNENGQWEVEDETWGVFEVMWPRPDLLILGLGKEMQLLSTKTSSKIYSLGIRVEIQDTRNAAAQFNLLATERGINNIAAALVPIGWKEGIGVQV